MKCPSCGYEDSKVIDTRPVEENNSIKRENPTRIMGFSPKMLMETRNANVTIHRNLSVDVNF